MNKYLPKYRVDPETGKATFAVIQAEDELAALGMVIGAGWAGARAMTSTSGPGLDLMAEFAGLAYFVEVPAVIWDVQRVGPEHRFAHPHQPGRHRGRVLPEPRRQASSAALPGRSEGVLRVRLAWPSIWPNGSKRW